MKCNSKTESIPLSAVMSLRQLGQLAVFSTLVNHPVVKSSSDGEVREMKRCLHSCKR